MKFSAESYHEKMARLPLEKHVIVITSLFCKWRKGGSAKMSSPSCIVRGILAKGTERPSKSQGGSEIPERNELRNKYDEVPTSVKERR